MTYLGYTIEHNYDGVDSLTSVSKDEFNEVYENIGAKEVVDMLKNREGVEDDE